MEESVLKGRPYGGTGILYKKELAKAVNIKHSDNDQITAAKVSAIGCEFIVLSAYLPADYCDNDSYDNYLIIVKIIAMTIMLKSVHILSLSCLSMTVTISLYRWQSQL